VPENIPDSLNGWTFDIIDNLVSAGISEGYKFDYKKDLTDSDTITDLCCAFANTDGGFIIFGVDESSVFSIFGLKYDKEYSNKFSDKLRAEPEIKFNMKNIEVPKQNKYLYVFEIPKSDLRPHTNCDPQKKNFG
jgi:predicted HTH transcriptional regulator